MAQTQQASVYSQLSKKNQFAHGQSMLEKLMQFPAEEKLKILDIGCGTGDLAKLLADKFQNSTIHACDPSSERISFAMENNAAPQISYFINDATSFLSSKQDEYDVIYSNYVLHWIKDKESLFCGIKKALKLEGISFHWTMYKDIEDTFFVHLLNPAEVKNLRLSLPMVPEQELKRLASEAGLLTYYFDSHIGGWNDWTLDQYLDMLESLKDIIGVSIKDKFHQYPNKEFLKNKMALTDEGHVSYERTYICFAMKKQNVAIERLATNE